MKKIITNLCFLFFALSLNATIRTVSNSPNNFAQFNTIQAAIDASANGDSIYVSGSNIVYPNATISNKILKIFGAGWAPNTIPNLYSKVGSILINGSSHGTEIHGMYIIGTGGISMAGMNNISIVRNYFESYNSGQTSSIDVGCNIYTPIDNLLIEGNYFGGTWIGTHCDAVVYNNALIINNIFNWGGGHSYILFRGIISANCVVEHNLFYGVGNIFTFGSNSFVMRNNIIVNCNPTSVNCSWENNITYNCAGTNTPWIGGTNSGTGNIANTDPQMVDQAAVNSNTNNPLLDFTIPAGSANNAGTDGKDLGLMFDPTGYLNWTYSRNPKLPVVNNLIINSTANPGGNLEIHLNASQAK